MHTVFKQMMTKFYDNATKTKQHSQVFKNAIQRNLTYAEFQQERNRERDKDSQEIKPFKSANSASSLNFIRIKKLFHSIRFQTIVFFSYFLQVLKNKKNQYIGIVLQKIHEKLLAFKKRVTNEQKKRFQTKFNRFADLMIYLTEHSKLNRQFEWLYYQVFNQFESECLLLSQLLSSTSDQLQSLQNIKANDYATLMNLLKSKCSLFNRKTKESKVFGTGEIKIYIGRKNESSYFVLTQKQFELQLRHTQRNVSQKHTKMEEEDTQTNEMKKYSTSKFKEQILAQLQKLKQEYEVNTAKIATLFNFKDRTDVSKTIDESRQA